MSPHGHYLYKRCKARAISDPCQVQDNLISKLLKVFTVYARPGHLGHETITIYINPRVPFPWRLHMKFGFDWPSGFRGEDLSKLFTIVDDDGRRDWRTDGALVFLKLTSEPAAQVS